MECIGTEANGGLATYGEPDCDYETARDFVVAQAFLMNDLKKYMEQLDYSPDRWSFEDLINDFEVWWDDPNGEEWYDLAKFYFDGHELKEGNKNETI